MRQLRGCRWTYIPQSSSLQDYTNPCDSRQHTVPPRMELSSQGREQAGPILFVCFVLALAYCVHWSLFSRLVRTVFPFWAAGSSAQISHLRRSFKVQARVLSSQQLVSQGQVFHLLMVPVVKILMKLFTGVSTSRLRLNVVAFSVA